MSPCTHLPSLQSQGNSVPWRLPSLSDPRRIVGFLACSAFYLLLGHHGNFQAPYLQNRKLKTSSNFFCYQHQIISGAYLLKHFNTVLVGKMNKQTNVQIQICLFQLCKHYWTNLFKFNQNLLIYLFYRSIFWTTNIFSLSSKMTLKYVKVTDMILSCLFFRNKSGQMFLWVIVTVYR